MDVASPAPDADLHGEASCPRCGYDLRGVLAGWSHCCPLEGTCAECGLRFQWAEVLVPGRFLPLWCVEFAQPRRRVPWAAVATYLRCFRPSRFWRALRMSQPIRPARLAVYLAFLLMLPMLAYVIEQSTVAIMVHRSCQQYLVMVQRQTQNRLAMLQRTVEERELSDVDEPTLLQYQARLQRAAGQTGSISHSYAAAIWEAVAFPLRRTSSGSLTVPGRGSTSYPAPRDLQQTLLGGVAPAPGEMLIESASALGAGVLAHLMLPVGFVFLPISRRRAKVRWIHIARVTLYGLFIPATVVTAALLLLAAAMADPSRSGGWLTALQLTVWCGVPGLTIVWWAQATGRYLMIPHGWAVAVVLTVLCWLVLLGAILVLVPFLP